jgi:hypothetical protein
MPQGISNPLYETQLDYVLGNARGRAVVKNCRVKKSHHINWHGGSSQPASQPAAEISH